ncbi:MAG: hypothetical protein Q9224_002821, partial [Gallowayella concinna]
MSVQTRVMVDGRWTTRTLDIHQILARNREEKEAMLEEEASHPIQPPVLGLLTRTLVKSPVVRSIIPARIRHRSKNDVVFVYDDAIVIKEVLGGERIEQDPFRDIALAEVIEKRDFDSPILVAKIMGLRREPKAPQFPGYSWDPRSDGYRSQSPIETKPDPLHENEIPPQILVLSLVSRTLLFLFAYHDVYERVHFLSNTWRLPAQAEQIEELGRHLAVDPRSRAMAVGAHQNRVIIYTLKSMDQLKKEVQKPEGLDAREFKPILEERHTELDGVILKMEFLHPSKGDEHRVILLLVVAKPTKTRLVRFEWDCRTGLSELERKPNQALPDSERIPLLLIPLTYRTSFALVCEHHITVYRDILTGNARGETGQLEHYEPAEECSGSTTPPIWTQWVRPMRPIERAQPAIDNIYLCREDGVVRYIDIGENSIPMIASYHEAGILKTNLSGAFATLDLGNESNDLLVAAGEMADGGMWYFTPREALDLVGTFRNWTPLRDITTARVKSPNSSLNGMEGQLFEETERLFACSGRGPRHSVITEVRVGTEAVKLGPSVDLGELAEPRILNMWALPDQFNTGIYLMVSHAADTELILLPDPNNQDSQAASRIEELDLNVRTVAAGLDLDVRTIAAGSTAEGYLIQVTSSSIKAIAQDRGILPLSWEPEEASITTASFITIPSRTTVLLTVLQNPNGFYLHHGHFGTRDGRIAFDELGEPILLRSEASSASLHWVEGLLIAFVGTFVGTLQVYTAEPGSCFRPYFEFSFAHRHAICDSIVMLTTDFQLPPNEAVQEGYMVVCGLRNGVVETLWFDGGNKREHKQYGSSFGGQHLSLCERLDIGMTDVKVMADATRSSRAFLVCERNLYTLEYLGGASRTNPGVVNKVWLTDSNSSSFQQDPLTCFTQASANIPQGCSKFAAGSLFYLARSSLVLADISSSPVAEMVPRRLPLLGTPTKILYSERLNSLVVLYTTTAINTTGRVAAKRDRPQSGAQHPAIAIIKPGAELLRPDQDARDMLNVLDATEVLSGEKFLGLMEWFPTDGIKQYHLLVAHTLVGQSGSQEATRRLLFFKPILNDVGEVSLKPKIKLEHRAEISAIASYGDSSLIYGCGDDLVLRTLDMNSKKKFKPMVKLTLRSPAINISVEGTNIHVSTELHGHHIISVEDNQLVSKWADRTSRTGAYHLVVPKSSVVMVVDLECRVSGLWQPPKPQLDRTAPFLFEAVLPRSITRLCRVPRPLWQDKHSELIHREAIIGTCEDGTIYQLSLLNEMSWRLLAFIQNMAIREPRICPYPKPRAYKQGIKPLLVKDRNMHIDGDILIRLLERDGKRLLLKMLGELDREDGWVMFNDLIQGVFGGKVPD